MDLCKLEGELYRKQVFDTANMIIIFARLDENNHLGLFFHKDKIVENQIQFVEKTFKIIEDVQKEPSEAPPEEVDLI
jgi:alpha-amylase/alpha-mannosidase (GH57 family)